MKANDHEAILRVVEAQGVGFEAVSRGELTHLFETLPDLDRSRVLFTPNFASNDDYIYAVEQGVWVNIDNIEVLKNWGETFRNTPILLRVDPGQGRGHHAHVHTGGKRSKFGITKTEVNRQSVSRSLRPQILVYTLMWAAVRSSGAGGYCNVVCVLPKPLRQCSLSLWVRSVVES